MEMGKNRLQDYLDVALEVYPDVLTATETTIFAYLPILHMTGEVGKFMKALPILITIILLSSLVEAFYILPIHAQQIYDVKKTENRSNIISDMTQ
ncbi:hypothetical protein CRV02_14655, partial [Arcobacter sp. CECT 8989]